MPHFAEILLILITAIAIMRVMGKAAISQLTPYDLLTILIIGAVAAEPLISPEYRKSLYSVGLVTLFYLVFSKLSLNRYVNKFLLGEPTILIKRGKFIEPNLRRSRLSVMQVMATLRARGYPRLEEIEYAILEPVGDISVIPKSQVSSVTLADLGIDAPYEGLPLTVIVDGKIQEQNLELIGKTAGFISEILRRNNITLDEVFYASLDDRGNFYLDLRGGRVKQILIP